MIVLDSETTAMDLVEGLLQCGIVIRPLRAFGLANCVRLSTGTDEQMEACLEAFQSVLPAVFR
jgi:histidinol-phosphate aminotransferase